MLRHLTNQNFKYICTRKMVPIARRASSFLLLFLYVHWLSFKKQNRKEKEESKQQQT